MNLIRSIAIIVASQIAAVPSNAAQGGGVTNAPPLLKVGIASVNSRTRLGLMAVDLCKISTQEFAAVRSAAQKAGIPPQQMIINCSHTHCGPVMGPTNTAYVAQFTAKASSLPAAAVAGLADAKLDFALGGSTMGVNRRRK